MKKFLIGATVFIILGIFATTMIEYSVGNKDGIPEKIEAHKYFNKILFRNPTQAVNTTNLIHIKKRGTSSERPTGVLQGFVYFDTSLDRPIYWNGKVWVDTSVINLKDFGAKGDGVADDTKAIQNALNIARDYGEIRLYFPTGVYNTETLRLYKNSHVTMNRKAIIRRIGKGYSLFTNGKVGEEDFATEYNGEGNIHFKGGTIDLNTINAPIPKYKGSAAFNLAHAENISFRYLKIINGQNGHYFQISSCKNVLFDDSWFGNVRYTNKSSKNFELIQIEEATKISFPPFGSYDGTISKNITIQNCYFQNVIRAIGTHSYPRAKDGVTPLHYNENIRVINNVFKNSVSHFGHFEAFKNVVIENNVFENYGEYPIYFNKSMHITVKNNLFNGSMNETY